MRLKHGLKDPRKAHGFCGHDAAHPVRKAGCHGRFKVRGALPGIVAGKAPVDKFSKSGVKLSTLSFETVQP